MQCSLQRGAAKDVEDLYDKVEDGSNSMDCSGFIWFFSPFLLFKSSQAVSGVAFCQEALSDIACRVKSSGFPTVRCK